MDLPLIPSDLFSTTPTTIPIRFRPRSGYDHRQATPHPSTTIKLTDISLNRTTRPYSSRRTIENEISEQRDKSLESSRDVGRTTYFAHRGSSANTEEGDRFASMGMSSRFLSFSLPAPNLRHSGWGCSITDCSLFLFPAATSITRSGIYHSTRQYAFSLS